jgi:N-methylhydantoinase A
MRDVYFGPDVGTCSTAILRRDDVGPDGMPGPVIIEEFDTSTVVPPHASVRLDEHRNLRIRVEQP